MVLKWSKELVKGFIKFANVFAKILRITQSYKIDTKELKDSINEARKLLGYYYNDIQNIEDAEKKKENDNKQVQSEKNKN